MLNESWLCYKTWLVRWILLLPSSNFDFRFFRRYSTLFPDGSITSSAKLTFFFFFFFSLFFISTHLKKNSKIWIKNLEHAHQWNFLQKYGIKILVPIWQKKDISTKLKFKLLHVIGEETFVQLSHKEHRASGDGKDCHEPSRAVHISSCLKYWFVLLIWMRG